MVKERVELCEISGNIHILASEADPAMKLIRPPYEISELRNNIL